MTNKFLDAQTIKDFEMRPYNAGTKANPMWQIRDADAEIVVATLGPMFNTEANALRVIDALQMTAEHYKPKRPRTDGVMSAIAEAPFKMLPGGDPDEDPRGAQVWFDYDGRRLLGDVRGMEHDPVTGTFRLNVTHFNGEPWPIKPPMRAVTVMRRRNK